MTLKTFEEPSDSTTDPNQNENSSWEDLEIDLDEDKDCKLFPSKTYENVRNLAAAGVPILVSIQLATFILGEGFGGIEIRRQMQDLTCKLLELVAETWHGGGTEECIEYEEVPGHKWICDEDAEDDQSE